MATTFIDYIGDGVATKTFAFPSIQVSDIKVDVDGFIKTSGVHYNITGYTTGSGGSVVFTSGNIPVSPQNIRIFRETNVDTPKATYTPGSSVKAADLNNNNQQLLFSAQEEQNQTIMAHDIKDNTITSAKIVDGAILNADINASAAIDGTKVTPSFGAQNVSTTGTAATGALTVTGNIAVSGTVDSRDIAADGTKLDTVETNAKDDQTAAEIRTLVNSASDSNVFTDADHTKLNGIESGATADQTDAEIRAAVEAATDSNVFTDADHTKLNSVETGATADQTVSEIKGLIANSPLDSSHLAANSVGDSELASAQLTTLAGMQSGTASKLADNTSLTADLADLNQLDGMAKQTTITDDDTKFPTSGAVIDYVTAQIAPIGGFEVIATDQAFPNTQPAAGVVISMADGGGLVVNGSGTSTTGRTVGGSTVTINNFASNFNNTTVDPGVAILVSSTGSGQVYNYHKATLKEADLLSLSGDINDFAERYRVVASEPTSDNDEGDLIYDKSADLIKVYDSTLGAFKTINTTGEFQFLFLCPTGSSGAPTFDGTINTYDLRVGSNAGTAAVVTSAAQLIVSIDGVIQKPNTGTSQPAEGFAMVDGNTIVFGSNLEAGVQVFISQIGDAVNIGTPTDNTVSTDKLQNLSVTTNKLANDAVTNDKLANSIVSTIAANTAKNTNVTTNLSTSTTTTAVTVASSDGTNATIGEATSSAAGVMSSAHHDKLDGIEAGATGDQTNAEIRAAVEAATDSNVFTDADHSKLNGIEAGATADQTAAEIRTLVENASDSNVFTDADHTKLNGIETSATADQTASEIVALVANQTIAPSTINLPDSSSSSTGRLSFGANTDIQIYHDSTTSNNYIRANNGYLYLTANNLRITNSGLTESFIKADANGAVELYYDNSKKLETTSTGIKATGNILANLSSALNTQAGSIQAAGPIIAKSYINAHTSNAAVIEYNNNVSAIRAYGATAGSGQLAFQVGGGGDAADFEAMRITNDGHVRIPADSKKLQIGASQDLQIYHLNGDSYITNSDGNLNIVNSTDGWIRLQPVSGEEGIVAKPNAAVELYYDGSKKLETQSTGVNITGTLKVNGNVIASGGLGNIVEDTSPQLGGDLDFNGNNALLQGPGTGVSTNWDNDAWEKIVFDNSYNTNPQGPNKIVLHTQAGWHAGFGVAAGELGMYSGADIAFYTNTSDSTASAKETLAKFVSDGAVELYYDGVKKLETTALGVSADYYTGTDNAQLRLGDSGDLQIYHNGSTSIIASPSHSLAYYGYARHDFLNGSGSERMALFLENGACQLYYDNSKKLETTSSGVTVTGDLVPEANATRALGSGSLRWAGAHITALRIYTDGQWYDNAKALFGHGEDLQIYHDGSHSFIDSTKAGGQVLIRTKESGGTTNNAAKFMPDGSVELYYDGSKKFTTEASGEYGSFTASNGTNGWDGMRVGGSNIVFMGQSTIAGIWNDADNEWMIKSFRNGTAELYYDGSKKLETTSGGVSVTGSLTASANLYAGAVQLSGSIFVSDSNKLNLGTGNDLEMYHNGSHSYIKNKTGSLYIMANSSDVGIQIVPNASVKLRYNDANTFETLSGGNRFYGYLFGSDNAKLYLGDSNDLKLWHDGTKSYIQNATGTMNILCHVLNVKNDVGNETMIEANANDDVRLMYNNSIKLYTASYGIQVGSAGGSVFSGLSNYQAYVGFDANSSSSFGGIVMGSGPNGNSPFIAASKAGNGTGLNLGLRTNGSVRLLIQNNGNIGAPSGNNIYNASDERLKENMVELTDGLSKINQIKPYSFTWKSGFDKNLEGVTQYGFGAHQTKSVDEILVEPFCEEDIELNGETIENPLRVNEKFIIPMLVKAVQELSAKVTALEAA